LNTGRFERSISDSHHLENKPVRGVNCQSLYKEQVKYLDYLRSDLYYRHDQSGHPLCHSFSFNLVPSLYDFVSLHSPTFRSVKRSRQSDINWAALFQALGSPTSRPGLRTSRFLLCTCDILSLASLSGRSMAISEFRPWPRRGHLSSFDDTRMRSALTYSPVTSSPCYSRMAYENAR